MEPFEALEQAMALSFADMAFMDATQANAPDDDVSFGQIVHLEFAHPLSGYLTLYLSAATKQRIVENVYGFGWEDLADSVVDDCLMEMVNIVAGNFLRLMGDDEYRHAVSLPQVLYDDSDLPASDNTIIQFYRADDEFMRAVLVYKPPDVAN